VETPAWRRCNDRRYGKKPGRHGDNPQPSSLTVKAEGEGSETIESLP